MSHPSPYSPPVGESGESGAQRANGTSLNARPVQWGDPLALLCCGGTCYWHGLGTISHLQGWVTVNQYQVVLSYHLSSVMKHFYLDGSALSDSASIHRAHGVTEWFDEYENYVNHMPWPSQPHRASSLRWHLGFLVLQVLFSPKKQI